MTVNAEPQVRSGSLPTSTPRTIARPQGPAAAAQPAPVAQGAEGAETAPEAVQTAEKPKRKYNRRKPAQLNSDADLSNEELAAWGAIALEARKAGVSVERYMTDLERSVGLKLQVWSKLKPVESEQVPEQESAEVAA